MSNQPTKGPVLFYFWAHNVLEELMTPKLVSLLSRSDTVFCELVTDSEGQSQRLEQNLNILADESVPDSEKFHLMSPFYTEMTVFLVSQAIECGYSFELERTVTDLDDLAEMRRKNWYTLREGTVKNSIRELTDLTYTELGYHRQREQKVAEDICRLPGTVTVLFGADHDNLAKLVSGEREIEVHHPYPDYRVSYARKVWDSVEKGRPITKELFLRSFMQMFVQNSLFESFDPSRPQPLTDGIYTAREVSLMSRRYADEWRPAQIEDLREYVQFCERRSCLSPSMCLESYLKSRQLPPVSDMAKKVREDIAATGQASFVFTF